MMNQDDLPVQAPRAPPPFPEPMIESCVRIGTNVYDENGIIAFFSDRVLVKRRTSALFSHAGNFAVCGEDMDISTQSSSSSSSSRSICKSSISSSDISEGQHERRGVDNQDEDHECAYLICELIHNAVHGQVYRGIVLHRTSPADDWQMTLKQCAIKQMSWEKIHAGRERRLQENPRDEIAAMQHVMQCLAGIRGQEISTQDTISESKIIAPLDFLYDDRYLYNITPLCTDGEVFALLQNRRTFSEEESRYLLRNILDGLESLQKVGLCHRDISLENILVDGDRTIIIDMGMCLRIPFLDDEEDDADMLRNVDHRDRSEQRCLISSQIPCGKASYISPEVHEGRPFDGHAVDIWAVGVCLFIMLTGNAPWKTPLAFDKGFKFIAINGNLTTLMRHWGIPLSENAMHLLQHMLRQNPADRLNLQQVRDHPWMDGPESNPMAP